MEIKKSKVSVEGIPAIIWGNESNKVFIYIHGKMSCKEYAEQFAIIADEKGYQTVSFDLPEHGERVDHSYRCDIWNGIKDLTTIANFVYSKWNNVSLFACSLGAYFALNSYEDREFKQILFQSPIVDMEWLVERMMEWNCVTLEQLELEKEIETPIDTLRWDYYNYIKEHPIEKWHEGTHILYGQLDNLQSKDCILNFSEKYFGQLAIAEESEHAFMSERDFEIVNEWLTQTIVN